MNPDKYESELIAKVRKMLRMSVFSLESIAHLRGREKAMLPLVAALEAVNEALAKPEQPTHVFVMPADDVRLLLNLVESEANISTTDAAAYWRSIQTRIEAVKGAT